MENIENRNFCRGLWVTAFTRGHAHTVRTYEMKRTYLSTAFVVLLRLPTLMRMLARRLENGLLIKALIK